MTRNKVSQILFYIGIFIIGIGVISGLIAGNTLGIEYESFNLGVFFYFTIAGFISGMIFIALSEIIKLLHSINLKMGPNPTLEKDTEVDDTIDFQGDTWMIDATDWDLAEEMGRREEAKLIDIIPTPYTRYGIVILVKGESTFELVVDFGGFKVEKVKNEDLVEKILTWYKDKRQ